MSIEYCNEILDKINKGYKVSSLAFKIGEAALNGMLYEISTSPSPGLVSPHSNGAHSDMNFFTFLNSTASIAYAMYLCAQIGIDYENDILKKIRTAGFHAEKNMMKSTNGVNTQKGLLFLAGVVCASAGMCIRKNEALNRENISKNCSLICEGIVDRELTQLTQNRKLTNGEKLYFKYGSKGIRGEIEDGLPSVLNTGLVAYDNALINGLSENDALVHALINLMTIVDDTTVLNRCGIDGIKFMRETSRKALELGGMLSPRGREYIVKMDEKFINKNISPGGAADLLAITAMIKKIEIDFGRSTNE